MIGGFFSIIVYILLIIYFSLGVNKLATADSNKISYIATNDLQEMGPIQYKDTGIKFFAIIRKDGIGANTPYINGSSNFSQYLNVYWTQVIGNYYIPNDLGLNRFVYRNISAKNCTLEDFGYNEQSI